MTRKDVRLRLSVADELFGLADAMRSVAMAAAFYVDPSGEKSTHEYAVSIMEKHGKTPLETYDDVPVKLATAADMQQAAWILKSMTADEYASFSAAMAAIRRIVATQH